MRIVQTIDTITSLVKSRVDSLKTLGTIHKTVV